MVTRIAWCIAGAAALSFGLASTEARAGKAFSDCQAIVEPNILQFDILNVRLCANMACSPGVSLIDAGSGVDVGDDTANPNTPVTTLPGTNTIPAGTYLFLELTAGLSVTASGQIDFGKGTFCSTPGGNALGGVATTPVDVPEDPLATLFPFTFPANANIPFPDGSLLSTSGGQILAKFALDPPFVAVDGAQSQMPVFDFNIDEILFSFFRFGDEDCGFAVATPSITMNFDGRSVELTSVDDIGICDFIDEALGEEQDFPAAGSDYEMKTDIELVTRLSNGLGIYKFRYAWGGPRFVGVMAHEVAGIVPEALVERPGFNEVDYAKLMQVPLIREEVRALGY